MDSRGGLGGCLRCEDNRRERSLHHTAVAHCVREAQHLQRGIRENTHAWIRPKGRAAYGVHALASGQEMRRVISRLHPASGALLDASRLVCVVLPAVVAEEPAAPYSQLGYRRLDTAGQAGTNLCPTLLGALVC